MINYDNDNTIYKKSELSMSGDKNKVCTIIMNKISILIIGNPWLVENKKQETI